MATALLLLDEEMATELETEAARLGTSRSALLRRAWEIARETIATYPGRAEPARKFRVRRPRPIRARSWMVPDVEERAAEAFRPMPERRSTAEAVMARRPAPAAPPPPPPPEPTTTRARIVAMILSAGRPVGLAEIYEAMGGVNRLTIRVCIYRAKQAGHIGMIEPGLYGPPTGAPAMSQMTQLLGLLAIAPRSIRDVRVALDIRHSAAKDLVKFARRRGLVRRWAEGRYRLTPAGRKRIEKDAAAAAAGRYRWNGGKG